MRIASVAAVAACLGMFFAGIGTSYAGGIDKTVKTSAIPSVTRTTGYPKPDLTLPRGSQYTILIQSYAKQYGIPADLAHAIVEVESNFNAKARGSAGEVGLMQIKPATARMMGYTGSIKELYEPETNIKFGMKYLAKAQELSDGTTCGTILKYNAGHGAKRMNPVSKRYCGKVKNILDWL
ncbi:transglycosylase SLT domain-containing protein [Sinorhizobium meliloti WSM1022]|jgi:soluble lytic murein transglycosylase-like protein|uniref:Lysozyme n=5 Tax=Sinorhizobium TaxID=28105 RepID=Q92NL1_RHIME|nr:MULTISPECIES: transglycosylase SLT domain-containing protein [Sinorhizobium]PST25181.1 lytic transglycosylase domain-containing protein [Mesorhizobium loti]TWA92492.1 transglycosylase-like protein with SLT domain [Ensifer sp. SEMIA 134]TWB28615.1 transglycosylase-like protein with SLT domain [Ensifer sp. SEMIA 135]AEG04916.1 Lytic transglycosylase catalytic [Sinorhizobium meliloti BL225C]AEG53887.1 Lytic transglycosylase catalytic [Sinorhizobium meliloti AK83]